MDTMASRLKTARTEAGLTQGELARRSGVQQQSISLIERGESQNTRYVVALARACGVEPTWLQTGRGPRRQSDYTCLVDLATLDQAGRESVMRLVAALERGDIDPSRLALLVRAIVGDQPGD
jgi:transcriptional regulator with XRE-family HTH domain